MRHAVRITFAILVITLIIPSLALAGSATLHWQANTEPDLAGYRIYYGTSSRSYGAPISVDKNTTSYTINNLTDGQTYYFALTAVDTSGNESGYSQEVSKSISGGELPTASSPVEAFIYRFYRECLGREPDQEGYNAWVSAVSNGMATGADVARGFVLSEEFRGRNTTNEEFVTILYRALLGRDPDQGGYDYWLGQLNSGKSRADVLNTFMSCVEFAYRCYDFGLRPFPEGQNAKVQIEAFIYRFYRECLGREPDQEGYNWWVGMASRGLATGADVARGFLLSQEFRGRNTTNEEFVTILYKSVLGRDPDQGGYNYWLGQLNSGKIREEVLNAFLRSREFSEVCNTYGIRPF